MNKPKRKSNTLEDKCETKDSLSDTEGKATVETLQDFNGESAETIK